METSLIDIVLKTLRGKKIKLYRVLDKRNREEGVEYFITEKGVLEHPYKCTIIGEAYGFVQDIEVEHNFYDGDSYTIKIVDDNGVIMHVNGFYSVTCKIEILN